MKERSAIEILEEAVNLLRAAPVRALAVYLTGAVPFTLALLFFLSDMTRSPFAPDHVGAASLAVAILYVWKNVWQAVFMQKLYALLSPDRTGAGNLAKVIAIQATFQPVGLVLMLPFPWLVAFFRNVALFGALNAEDPIRMAGRQAALWPRQNWGVLGLLTLGGILLLANLLILIVALPQLARSFLGIEGDFARLGSGILNLTTGGVAAALAWLAIDPLLDAVYVLRCFYGASIATGEDLRSALRRAIATTATVIALLMILGLDARPLRAQPRPEAERSGAAIDARSLDKSIDDVIHRREFTWRAPRPAGEEPKGRWVGWARSVQEMLGKFIAWVAKEIREWFKPNPGATESPAQNAPVTPRMLEVLIAIAVALAAGAAVAWFRNRRSHVAQAEAVPVAVSSVNLADESITADQLPESSWLKLAEEWLAKGDCRLALRALYLAGLNYLGENDLVSIRRWKSGLDYRRELERRARANPQIGVIFARNVALFERGWYGRHPVDREMVEQFATGLSEMKIHSADRVGTEVHAAQ
jgi:hypothetical protein